MMCRIIILKKNRLSFHSSSNIVLLFVENMSLQNKIILSNGADSDTGLKKKNTQNFSELKLISKINSVLVISFTQQ